MSTLAKTIAVWLMVAAGLVATPSIVSTARAQAGRDGGGSPLPADGAALYQAKCGSCHSITTNKIGPAHKGVFGRKAAMAPGYKYSPALKAANLTWDAATLDKWLQGPQKLAKGSRMYLVVPDPADRAAIIAYLRSDAAR